MSTPLEWLAAALAEAVADAPLADVSRGPVALGWATVELDRAASELAAALGTSAADFLPAADSELLGARCRVAGGALPGRLSLAILEPATEGRLAATLARVGEGPAAVWLAAEDEIVAGTSAAHEGPFGPERIVLGGPIHGPHRLLVGPGTIGA
jgi:hypothetical protein